MKTKNIFLLLALAALPFLSQETTAAGEYKLVFSDEFNDTNGSMPDDSKWVRCVRYSSTWNRWLSKTDDGHALTGFIQDGHFVARAVPNPYTATDDVPMITGGIKSMGKFSFKYGKVECRLKTNPYSGNFPALWMMPADQSAGWPDCGEIDIWEAINSETLSYHTIHSNWTFDLGNKWNPTSSFTHSASQSEYHVYGLEWDENALKWYVDGTLIATYAKSTNQSTLDQGQWPFDKEFYLILNQSVGDGSWAYNADVTHTYETVFDWVRVYQKEETESSENDYCGSDWGNASSTYSRHLNSLFLTGGSDASTTITGFDTSDTHAVYNDCTSQTFRAEAGSTISLKPTSTGTVNWSHGYVYIDYNNDGEFTPDINTATGLVNAGSELVAYSYYETNDLTGFDSAGNRYEGEQSANRAGSILTDGRIPSFQLPDDLASGNYRMRFKLDWNSIDPCGNAASDNLITANGGYIIDFTLQVENPTSAAEKVEAKVQLYYHDGFIYTNTESEIQVFDLNGRLVKQTDFAPVNVTSLAKGVYVVKTNGKTLKFVK